jgi:hypothetical protein
MRVLIASLVSLFVAGCFSEAESEKQLNRLLVRYGTARQVDGHDRELSRIRAALRTGRMAVNPVVLETCLAGRSPFADGPFSDKPLGFWPSECQGLWVGHTNIGERCDTGFACTTGACTRSDTPLHVASNDQCGVCTEKPADRIACLFCAGATSVPCSNSTCRVATRDHPCGGDTQCGEGLVCVASPTTGSFRCIPSARAGDACEEPLQCPVDFTCVEKVCVRSLAPGEACGNSSAACMSWTACVSGRCSRRPDVGEPCSELQSCSRGMCLAGVCQDGGGVPLCAGSGTCAGFCVLGDGRAPPDFFTP